MKFDSLGILMYSGLFFLKGPIPAFCGLVHKSFNNFVERFKQGNNLKWTAEQKTNFSARKWTIGVNEQNPYAKAKGKNGPHLKGLQIFAPGETVKKNTCYCEFDTETKARNTLAKLTSDDIANTYQLVTTKRTISSVVLRMLKI